MIHYWGKVALAVLFAYAFIVWVWSTFKKPPTSIEKDPPKKEDHGLWGSNRDRSKSHYDGWN